MIDSLMQSVEAGHHAGPFNVVAEPGFNVGVSLDRLMKIGGGVAKRLMN